MSIKNPKVFEYILISVLLIGVLLLTFNNLKIGWMLIDDGYTAYYVDIMGGFLNKLQFREFVDLLFETSGRFRPVYWLYNYAVWLVGGSNPLIHRISHNIVLALVCVLIYKLINKATESRVAAITSVLIFLLSPINNENILRLGPQEPLMTFLILSGVYALFYSQKRLWTTVLFLLALFTKETSVAIIPGIIITNVLKNKLKIDSKYLKRLLSVVISVGVFLFVLYYTGRHDGYISSYELTPRSAFGNLFSYLETLSAYSTLPVFIIPIAYLIVLPTQIDLKRPFYYLTIFTVFFFSFLLVLSPWEFVLPRYLMPPFAFLVIIFGISFGSLYKFAEKSYGRLVFFINLFLVTFLIFLITSFGTRLQSSIIKQVYETQAINSAMKFVAENAAENGVIYVNLKKGDHTIEYISETGLHQKMFWGRGDLRVDYLHEERVAGGVIVDIGVAEKLYETEKLRNDYPERFVKTIEINGVFPVFTTPEGFVKEFAKKGLKLIRHGEKPNLDGIYTQYRYGSVWNIFI